jgi:hypothetical protein
MKLTHTMHTKVNRRFSHGSRLPPLNRASRERSTTSALRSTCGRTCAACAPGASSSAVVVTGWAVSPVLRPRRTARTGPVPRLQQEARAGSARHYKGRWSAGQGRRAGRRTVPMLSSKVQERLIEPNVQEKRGCEHVCRQHRGRAGRIMSKPRTRYLLHPRASSTSTIRFATPPTVTEPSSDAIPALYPA